MSWLRKKRTSNLYASYSLLGRFQAYKHIEQCKKRFNKSIDYAAYRDRWKKSSSCENIELRAASKESQRRLRNSMTINYLQFLTSRLTEYFSSAYLPQYKFFVRAGMVPLLVLLALIGLC